MKECSLQAKIFISGVILGGMVLLIWNTLTAEIVPIGNVIVAVFAGIAQIFKVEGPTERSNYNISWVFYGFSFLLYGTFGTLFVILIAHLMEWAWHRYPWYIQSFYITVYSIAATVIKLVRGQSFQESGVFEGITLVIDATLLGLGVGSAMIWEMNPYLALLNVIPVYLLYNALRVPAMKRKIQELETKATMPL